MAHESTRACFPRTQGAQDRTDQRGLNSPVLDSLLFHGVAARRLQGIINLRVIPGIVMPGSTQPEDTSDTSSRNC